jgi:hypothetical protein
MYSQPLVQVLYCASQFSRQLFASAMRGEADEDWAWSAVGASACAAGMIGCPASESRESPRGKAKSTESFMVDLPPNLRQPVKTRFSANGELSHGYFA